MKAKASEGKMQIGLDGYNGWLDGDREAFASTVEVYNKKLIYYIGSTLRDYDAAEDLASESFLRLLVKKPRFGSEEQLAAWLYRTARNLSLDRLRHAKHESNEELTETPADGELLDAVLSNERQRLLHETMKELKSEYRDVLLLLYFSGLSYEQIGKTMKKSMPQVKNLAFRARQSLKEKLERKGFTYEE